MKRFFLVVALCGIATLLSAQQLRPSVLYNMVAEKTRGGRQLNDLAIFNQIKTEGKQGNSVIRHFAKLAVNENTVLNTYNTKPDLVSINIPFDDKEYVLKLLEQPISSPADFSFGIIEKGIRKKMPGDAGVSYRGYINGDSSSFACISMFANGDIMGVFCNQEGNFNIGKMKNGGDDYVVYNSNDIVNPPRSSCSTDELPVIQNKSQKNTSTTYNTLVPNTIDAPPALLCNKVRLYWEADNRLYADNFNSNLTNTRNYLTGLFNVVSTIYQNEGIQIELSSLYIWTTVDPYSNTSSFSAISGFQDYWSALNDTFDGDFAHLVAGGPGNNGGIAYLNNNQCDRVFALGYSNVYATYQAYPSYSWDAYVVSHETGHNLGSHHTHWCGWNTGPSGACGSIDNCYKQEAADTCTTCYTITDINAAPVGFKGTVMSYCHLVSGVGVNLASGFGPLPQAVIRNSVNNAACFRQGSSWTGAVSTAWENAANWSCGTLPSATTDVTIGTGLTNYPVIKSAAVCHRITTALNAKITVNTGFTLTITGTSP